MTEPKIGVVIHTHLLDQIFLEEDRRRLEALGEVTWTDSAEPLSPGAAIETLAGCTVGIGSWGTPNPKSEGLPDACPDLRLWVHAAGSVKRMFGPHLQGRDLVIASCAPAIAETVAESTLGMLIFGLRRLQANGLANKRGPTPRPANVMALSDATIGILGASQVGRRVIRNLRPFGPRVLLYDPYVTEEEARDLGVELRTDVTDLCREAHAVSLHTPANPDCENILGAEQLAAMKDDGVVVNTARGMCLDEAALVAELQKGRLFAFLDVTAPEPAADESPLRRLENCLLTSHIAGGPTFKIGGQVVEDVAAFLEGRPLAMAVTAEMLERIA